MQIKAFPKPLQPHLIPVPRGNLEYACLACRGRQAIDKLLYTCPDCGGVLLIDNRDDRFIRNRRGGFWQRLFDYRRLLTEPALQGIFRYHELVAPILSLPDVLYLGEGHTPLIRANPALTRQIGVPFYFKNEGQNPSASFKDRGMACALSYLRYLIRSKKQKTILAVCASTGDTSASAALYAAYLGEAIRSAVLLPQGKVTPQQLSQPLGSGATVIEIPGVFDDCMKVVEYLSEHYPVALLNSKNAWRILGQETYAFEVAQALDYQCDRLALLVPIGNAGNITAILAGFLKLARYGLITTLPKIVGVQSRHANPVYKYYLEPVPRRRAFRPMAVQPSVAQAAMIGNPVSMPRVIELVERYNEWSGRRNVFVVEVAEQEIMDHMLLANRNGHIACTQGGESLAGLVRAVEEKKIGRRETAVLAATAHALKFSGFQDMYFQNSFPPEFEVRPRKALQNVPRTTGGELPPRPTDPAYAGFVERTAGKVARLLNL
jgi:threonine synthase